MVLSLNIPKPTLFPFFPGSDDQEPKLRHRISVPKNLFLTYLFSMPEALISTVLRNFGLSFRFDIALFCLSRLYREATPSTDLWLQHLELIVLLASQTESRSLI